MNSVTRRKKILEIFQNSNDYINATKLAEMFEVSRQIIVSDIAILRANGNNIIATQKGYITEKEYNTGIITTIICKHTNEQIRDEFYAIVDNGGSILNVIIEHPLYGQMSADLKIKSRFDADEFIEKAKKLNMKQLSDLTNGVHIHTLNIDNEKSLIRIKKALEEKNILINN